MKIEQVKKIFEEDDSLKYALATNIAKYGRPQSKKSDKKAKLTKSLEKKREKAVKDLKKSMDEIDNLVHVYDKDGKMFGTGEFVSMKGDKTLVRFDGSTEKEFPTSQVKMVKEQDMGSPFPGPDLDDKGYIAARKVIDQLRLTTFRKLNPDELESFRREIASAFDMTLKEGDTYEKMAAKGKKAGNLKQGTVRKRLGIPKDKKIPLNLINKELSRMRKMDKDDDKKGVQLGDKNQKYYKALQLAKTLKTTTNLNEDLDTLKRYKVQLDKLYGPQLRFIVNNFPNNPERSRIDVMGSQQELMNFGSEMHGTEMGDYEFFHVDDDDRGEMVSLVRSDSIMRGGSGGIYTEKKDKTDRCLRIARQKMPKTSAYRSGLIVKCRKGMIWKKRK